jgi:cellobiose epimerase
MTDIQSFRGLRQAIERELQENIIPFWMEQSVDRENGGFWGRISNDLLVEKSAEKGLILNTRILWTFSRLFVESGQSRFREMADRAYDYVMNHFWDHCHGGAYWMVDSHGQPADTKKKIYGQAFTIYALSEYGTAFRHREACERAQSLYRLVEEKSRDEIRGGYFESYERDWKLAADQRLSEVDLDEKKSMNTHLHVLEAYANLLRVWPDPGLRKALTALVNIFLARIIDPATWHFRLLFSDSWEPRSDGVSFGHDIEGSWLLCEAAEILGEPALIRPVRQAARMMARAVLDCGVDSDGGLLYEAEGGEISDDSKHWWPQAEAVVGFLNAYQLSGERDFYRAAAGSWQFIERFIIDRKHGEWFWKVSPAGEPSAEKYKVDAWKGPYHNTRACLEAISRLRQLEEREQE